MSFKWSVSDISSSGIIPGGSKVVDINVSSQMAQVGVDLLDLNLTGNQPPDLQDSFEIAAPVAGERVILGSDSDYFIGSSGDEYVVTGGGSDSIYAGAGDDIITVKGSEQATPETFKVTVESTSFGNKYFINGEQQATLSLQAGTTYIFDQSDQSNISHPLGLSPTYDGIHGVQATNDYTVPGYNYPVPDGLAYETVGIPGQPGAYTKITVAEDLNEIFYFCENHPEMGAGAGISLEQVDQSAQTIVDTGTGDDTVVISNDFSGTLLLKNGTGDNQLFINPSISNTAVDEHGTLIFTLVDGSKITTENYLEVDAATGKSVLSDKGFSSIVFSEYAPGGETYDLGFGDTPISLVRGSAQTDDLLYASNYNKQVNEDYHFFISARDGDDILYGGGGKTTLLGGEGGDTFYISSETQKTVVVGDREHDRLSNGNDNLPTVTTENTDFSDSVYLEWQKSEVTLSNPREGYFQIKHAGTGSVVDIYDVENLYFSDGKGGYEYKPLTEGQVIGKAHWQGEAAGMDIEYEQHNVSFQVDGDILKVLASATVMVTEEQFETYTLWTLGGSSFSEYDYPGLTAADWQSYGYTASEVTESLGEQTFEKQLDGVCIWEGNRTEVDAFEFADGVSVNVINVSTTDLADNPVFDTVGTDGIDLIFGNDGDNLIDGKGGDDIIFGGSGDDIIIGGEGDDVILGGDGADILRGDMVEAGDAAITAWDAAATQFKTDNPGENLVFDENKLSLQLSDSVDGDDLILGGDQLDDIESGDGKNFVSSGKADLDGNQQVDQNELDLINSQISETSNLFDDDEWM